MNALSIWILAVLLSLAAAIFDWRERRIPNWLTVSAALVGVALNAAVRGVPGVKQSLLGLGLGLLLLLPLALLRAIGAGDWKLAGALGATVGPGNLVVILMITILVAGVMALMLMVYTRRVWETLLRIREILRSLLWWQMPATEFTTVNPDALKIPLGVAMGASCILYVAGLAWSRR